MCYPYFPKVSGLSYPLKESLYKPKVRTEFENGMVQSRPRFTRAKKRFVLKWEKIPLEDKENLETFFNDIGGGVFIWTHPQTDKEYRCLMSDDTFESSLVEFVWWDVNLNIEEI